MSAELARTPPIMPLLLTLEQAERFAVASGSNALVALVAAARAEPPGARLLSDGKSFCLVHPEDP